MAQINKGADFNLRLKKLHYRAWHRGTREMDFLLGSFIDHILPKIDEGRLEALECLIEHPDGLLHELIIGGGNLDNKSEQELILDLRKFHNVTIKK